MPRVFVGVDAGGTSTIAGCAHDGVVTATHAGPAANATVCGSEAAAAAIVQTVVGALDGALPDAIFVGAAGASGAGVAQTIESALASQFPRARVAVRDDAFIALRAGVPQGDGAVLISGTGSIAFGVCGDREVRAGGYGYLLGDAGSGFGIGAAALKAALRALDGRSPMDDFARAICEQIGAADVPDAIGHIYSAGNAVTFVASIAPLVLEHADAGDRSANKIVQAAALDLADLAKSVVTRCGLADSGAPLLLSGSLLGRNSLLTFLLETRVKNELPMTPVLKGAPEPFHGALQAAREL